MHKLSKCLFWRIHLNLSCAMCKKIKTQLIHSLTSYTPKSSGAMHYCWWGLSWDSSQLLTINWPLIVSQLCNCLDRVMLPLAFLGVFLCASYDWYSWLHVPSLAHCRSPPSPDSVCYVWDSGFTSEWNGMVMTLHTIKTLHGLQKLSFSWPYDDFELPSLSQLPVVGLL